MRKIYAIEVLERKPGTIDPVVVFTKVLPDIPVKRRMPKTVDDLYERVEAMVVPAHVKTAIHSTIGFTVDWWFPKNFYRIAKVDWKYD